MNTPKVRWASAPDFAEVAEVLHVKTTLIFAVHQVDKNTHVALWTPVEDDERVFKVLLRRDPDGILRYASVPVEVPGFLAEVRRKIEKGLGDL